MTNSCPTSHPSPTRQLRRIGCVLSLFLALAVVTTNTAQAQTFTLIHVFTCCTGGEMPEAGLTMDRAGSFYGTTTYGGTNGYYNGIVYQLSRVGQSWVFTPIYEFPGPPDGSEPAARVVFGPDGALYGTTYFGGTYDQGTVFRLTPPPTICKTTLCYWDETVLYSFGSGPNDGINPGMGDLAFDAAGNIYGTTEGGGNYVQGCGQTGCGTVYKLSSNGGSWTESILYKFSETPAFSPIAGVILDNANNLYGTADLGSGSVYELTPGNGLWTENTLSEFPGSPKRPVGGFIWDATGNLYGGASKGGRHGLGAVYELARSGNGWNFIDVYDLNGDYEYPDAGPEASLTMDAAGNLYGTTYGGYHCGTVFKLTNSNGIWTYTLLHNFDCTNDGGLPISNVTIDSAGNLWGTASRYGQDGNGGGTIWEITP